MHDCSYLTILIVLPNFVYVALSVFVVRLVFRCIQYSDDIVLFSVVDLHDRPILRSRFCICSHSSCHADVDARCYARYHCGRRSCQYLSYLSCRCVLGLALFLHHCVARLSPLLQPRPPLAVVRCPAAVQACLGRSPSCRSCWRSQCPSARTWRGYLGPSGRFRAASPCRQSLSAPALRLKTNNYIAG